MLERTRLRERIRTRDRNIFYVVPDSRALLIKTNLPLDEASVTQGNLVEWQFTTTADGQVGCPPSFIKEGIEILETSFV